MNTTGMNGRVTRKTLASQLDRLDNTIDALADGLNKAVADAVREAVTGAIEAVIREVLSRPELLRQLAGPLPPAPAPAGESKPDRPGKLWRVLCWVGDRVSNAWRRLVTKGGELPSTLRAGVANLQESACGLCRRVSAVKQAAWGLRRPVLFSLLVGLSVGVIGYEAGPVMSSVALGLCGATMSFFAFLAAPFVRLWRCLRPQPAV